MKRVRMVVAYDGTAYRGWQLQPNGITIEASAEPGTDSSFKRTNFCHRCKPYGFRRTCPWNVAVFDTENRMPADKICFALNQRLPEDIRVQSSEEVPGGLASQKG